MNECKKHQLKLQAKQYKQLWPRPKQEVTGYQLTLAVEGCSDMTGFFFFSNVRWGQNKQEDIYFTSVSFFFFKSVAVNFHWNGKCTSSYDHYQLRTAEENNMRE